MDPLAIRADFAQLPKEMLPLKGSPTTRTKIEVGRGHASIVSSFSYLDISRVGIKMITTNC
jgi:hypothetical protein